MCEVLDQVENRGIQKGFELGIKQVFDLARYLISNNRMEDLDKICNDAAYFDKLLKEIFPEED